MKLRRSLNLVGIFLLGTALFINCGGDDEAESQSMSELQKQNGIPVEVKELQPEKFTKELTYFARLSGIKQTIRSSAVGGRIEKVITKWVIM